MPTSRSSTNFNARIFSPTVVVKGDTRRLEIQLKAGEGYGFETGITAGDCIYYDPVGLQYLKSSSVAENTAEVVGVVESISNGTYTVVTFGSINYPNERLSKIIEANLDDSKRDILFLDKGLNAGGLTGQVEIPTGSSQAIVKPVLQLAPHNNSAYNALVLNYMGYKIGNSAGLQEESLIGEVTTFPAGTDPGPSYRSLKEDVLLEISEYPVLYANFGIANGNHLIKLTMNSSVYINSSLIGQVVTQSSYYGNSTIGTVYSVDNDTVTVLRQPNTQQIINGYCSISGKTFNIINTDTTHFTIPARESYKIGETTFDYYIKVTPTVSVSIPNELNIDSLTVNNTLAVGAITDLESKITDIEAIINVIKTRIGLQ